MRIFRWVLLIANVVVAIMMATTVVVAVVVTRGDMSAVLPGGTFIALLLANIVFLLITWRGRHEGKAASRIAGAFD
ncbi:MAG: hypothetical protein FWD12_10420 [Alphaproteobacteria bacterium]|nr:hypothetical protein [Alphaproteobacteria bacterium]